MWEQGAGSSCKIKPQKTIFKWNFNNNNNDKQSLYVYFDYLYKSI